MGEEFNLEDARRALEAERAKRVRVCDLEIRAILNKYGLELQAQPFVTPDGRIGANIVFVDAPSRPSRATS